MSRIVSLLAVLSLYQGSFVFALSDSQLKFYRQNGYLIQQGFYEGVELENLKHQIQEALDAAVELPWRGSLPEEKLYSHGTLYVLGSAGTNKLPVIKRVVWAGARFPELLKYGRSPELKRNIALILESPKASHLINQIHPKLPGDGVEYDVHRDIDNRRNFDKDWQDVKGNGSFVQTMIAIDSMGEENGGLYVFPGSHRDCSPVKGNKVISEAYRQERREAKPPLIMKAGDIVYVHPCLVHFSGANQSSAPRRLFINGYAYPGANHVTYPGDGSTEEISLID